MGIIFFSRWEYYVLLLNNDNNRVKTAVKMVVDTAFIIENPSPFSDDLPCPSTNPPRKTSFV